MAIHAVIFDIGNVLMKFDYLPYIRRLLQDEDTIYRVNGAIWRSGYWNDLDRGEDPGVCIPRMIREEPSLSREIRLVLDHVGECMFRYDYAIPWVQELKSRGYKVYYLSNYSEFGMKANPSVLDFLPYMDGGVFSWEAGLVKPDPRIYRLLLTRYDLTPSECVFLDDFEANVNAARAEGMHAIRFRNESQGRADLERLLSD